MEASLLYTDDMHNFQMIDNYIYLYHVNQFIILPEYCGSIEDSTQVKFSPQTPLSRSAPIQSYTGSGPRTMNFSFDLHREMMKQINYGNNSLITDDYVDTLIKYIQAAALPVYSTAAKMVTPPTVALRMGEDVFIKGIISGSVSVKYELPILRNGKYAKVGITFGITEVDPYDARMAMTTGSYRASSTGNLNPTLERYEIL